MEKTALALGFFDGVHRAHRTLLETARAYGEAHGMTPAAVTFDRRPAAVLRGEPENLVMTYADRVRALTDCGMARVETLTFSYVRDMPWEEFVDRVLIEKYHAGFVAAGFDFRFGRCAEGDAEKLRTRLAEHGILCEILARMNGTDGTACSSREIRAMLTRGEVSRAAAEMGRAYGYDGVVVHGKGLGRRFGFPTMNVPIPEELVRPATGVYVTRVRVRGVWYAAVTNVNAAGLSESCAMDFTGDVYGERVRVEYRERLRGMRKFESWEALAEQIERDKEAARVYRE